MYRQELPEIVMISSQPRLHRVLALAASLLALASPSAAAPTGDSGDDLLLPQRVAELTQSLAEGLVAQFADALRVFDPAAGVVDWSEVGASVVSILLVIVPTIALFVVLRIAERPLFRRAGAWVEERSGARALGRRGLAMFGAALSDLAVIVAAWLAGYALALFVLGATGEMDPRQSLFLNAFLLLETIKAVVRILFAPRYHALRLLPVPDEEAAYWNAWIARLTDFVGYGLLLVVPVVGMDIAEGLAAMVSLAVVVIGLVWAVTIIRQNRERVRGRFEALAADSELTFNRIVFGTLARAWHLLAIVYFIALAIIIQLRPEDALVLMFQATVQTLLTLAIGTALYVALSHVVTRPMHIPAATRDRLPGLEERLNAFVPAGIHALRALIVLLILASLLDAWHLFDFFAWVTSDAGIGFLTRIISVALIVLVAAVLWVVFASWIDHTLSSDTGSGAPSARHKTLLTLLRSAVAVVLIILTTLVVLSELGINITPLLAGAGVFGLAIGFGAQKLVQDIITGVFIQVEDAINTGDVVTAGGITGVVERLTIRSVALRDLSGTLHIIPFSSVDSVSNFMRGFAFHVGEYGIAYREDIDEAIAALQSAFEELRNDPDWSEHILEDLEVSGVTALANSSVNVRVRIKTAPGMQWAIGRAYNRLVKRHLDAAGIEIPFPHMTLYFGENKDGSAPPAHLRILDQPPASGGEKPPRGKRKKNEQSDDTHEEPDQ